MGGLFRKKVARVCTAVLLAMVLLLTGCGSLSQSSSANDAGGGPAAGSASHSGFANHAVDSGYSSADASMAESATSMDSAPQQNSGAVSGSQANVAANAPGFGADEGNGAIHRKLIYRAYVTMEVGDYGTVQTEIRDLIQLSGGYLLEFNETNSEYERGGTFVIKVPSSGFMSFLTRLEEFSGDHRYQSSITGEDVTEEYVDLESRLKAKQVTEQRLFAFMERATRADDLVEFSRELGNVQQEIEQIKGRMRYLEQNVAYSTIEARVYEKSAAANRMRQENAPFGQRLSHSLTSVLQGISIVLQELVIFVVAALPIVILLAIFASPFIFWYWYRKREQSGQSIRRADVISHVPSAADDKPLLDVTEDATPEQQNAKQDGESRELQDDKQDGASQENKGD